MKQLQEYRAKLIDRLEAATDEFRSACLAIRDPYQTTDEDGWNIHQLAVHTRDADKLVYGLRIRRTQGIVEAKEHASMTVKGKSQPVEVYEVLGLKKIGD